MTVDLAIMLQRLVCLHGPSEKDYGVNRQMAKGPRVDTGRLTDLQAEELYRLAVTDPLTGLYNRRFFYEVIERELYRQRRYAIPLSLLFIDIDRFKNVNKSFGLVVGDSMLLTLGRRLSRHLNPQDTLARLGGDQFAILLISESDPDRKSTRLNSSHIQKSRMPSSA